MSRLDKLKEQHPDLNISILDIITSLDPTNTYKYTEFLIKNFKKSIYYSSNIEEFKRYIGVLIFSTKDVETLNEFEKHSSLNRIKEKDISKYDNFLELEEQVKIADEIEKRKTLEKQILKLHEDDTWLVLTPLSFEASKVYGSNTKWCVTQEKYWESYLSTHRLIYCINKKTNNKIAFSREFSTEKFQAWDQQDKEVSPMFINFIPDDIFLLIRNELQKELRTISLIRGDEPKRSFRISDLTGEMGDTIDSRNVIDRLRRLMGINSDTNVGIRPADTVDNNINPVVRRRITQFPQVNIPNLGDYLSDSDVLELNNEPRLSTNIGIITGSPGNIDHADSLSNHLTYWDHPAPRLVTEDDVRPITSFTGGTINY
jgi:hypothetical protein